jgi:hypothetical protein
MVVHLVSPDGRSISFSSNYALLQVRDELARLDGVATQRLRCANTRCGWLD